MKQLYEKNKMYILLLAVGMALLIFSTSFNQAPNSSTMLEARLTNILKKIDGIGEITVMIENGADNKAEGVIIVAQGAEDSTVKKTINDAALAVLGVKPHKIQVFAQKK